MIPVYGEDGVFRGSAEADEGCPFTPTGEHVDVYVGDCPQSCCKDYLCLRCGRVWRLELPE